MKADKARIDRLKEQLQIDPLRGRFRAGPDHGGGVRGHRRRSADHPPGQVPGDRAGAEEALHRRQPLRGQPWRAASTPCTRSRSGTWTG
ncbi:MAG: hypothetical protein MZV64_04855 [Ignavibacteriales bacterium]|nr:hypothetical protein [Ignavibacteriales bacterium]